MDKIESLPPLREVIAEHGLAAKKTLGQHFLLDLNLTRKIARQAPDLESGTVIEIGPGPGGLTRALLLEGAKNLVAIERDERCIEALQPLLDAAERRLKILSADAMQIKVSQFVPPVTIVANLPYNISTSLLINWLHDIAHDPGFIASMALMFQKEVADRIAAKPKTKDYGRLTIIAQHLCDVKAVMQIPARAFTPPPKIDSTVVLFTPKAKPDVPCDIEKLEKVTAAAFGQRRKMLRQSLKSLFKNPEETLRAVEINPTARAEEVKVNDFCKLANLL